MSRVAIVAALGREVRPLVREKEWRASEKHVDGRRFRFFEKDDFVLVCGGIGAEAARRAAEAVIAMYAPRVIYSVGFAGALDPGLKVGSIVQPRRVVNAGKACWSVSDRSRARSRRRACEIRLGRWRSTWKRLRLPVLRKCEELNSRW